MNKTDFLPQDIQKAIAHYKYCLFCLASTDEALKIGDLEMAGKRMADFERSLDELIRLKQKKVRQDQLKDVVNKLVSQGVLVDLVSFRRR